ncbi:hypothetical protein Q4S45_11395 [Massilia sp. R2A-15]|uniref:hypothetical protein n=1 Tax=Massilia sp. R2A-15 TaxID=3064278 RepID=UPI00273361F9|nr:hypothetical protein [Massilia sp. R2A-15]WLI91690.1 hypothetical protein Q4S45_11395 [Massilia sp. R2A-15]
MTLISALGPRPFQSLSPRPEWQDGAGAQAASATGKVAARLPVVEPVAQSSGSVSLSQQALNARLAQLGDQTVDAAQSLIGSFAQALFGDASKGASFNFDAISVSADTSMSAQVAHVSAAGGASVDAAALRFDESASFLGRGKIVTSDGQSYDFTLEVKYAASASASAAEAVVPDTVTLTGKELPPIEYPGSLSDLFKVLGRQLEVKADSGDGISGQGNLSMRLLRLVNSAALLAPRVRADAPAATPAERNRALASYAAPADSGAVTSA